MIETYTSSEFFSYIFLAIFIITSIIGFFLYIHYIYEIFADRRFKGRVIFKKIRPQYFQAVEKHQKNFELRKDENNFQPGDILILLEWDNDNYTGNSVERKIKYVLRNCPEYGLKDGYCIIGW